MKIKLWKCLGITIFELVSFDTDECLKTKGFTLSSKKTLFGNNSAKIILLVWRVFLEKYCKILTMGKSE